MKRQTGPDLWSDPADPENRAGLTPSDLLAGWRQPEMRLDPEARPGWYIVSEHATFSHRQRYQARWLRPAWYDGHLNVGSPPPEASGPWYDTLAEAEAEIAQSGYREYPRRPFTTTSATYAITAPGASCAARWEGRDDEPDQ